MEIGKLKKKNAKNVLQLFNESKSWKSEIEEIKSNKNAIQERYQNLQEKLSQERLLKTEMIGRKRYEVGDIERINKELEYLDMEQDEIERLLQEKVDNLEKVDTELLTKQEAEAKSQKEDISTRTHS